jgi:hypothetical protein
LSPVATGALLGSQIAAVDGCFDSIGASCAIDWWSLSSTMNPSRASAIAGATSAFHGVLPSFLCSAHRPATVPGTPVDRSPRRELSVRLPFSSRYMLAVAAPGAASRKSSATALPGPVRTTAKPPPPMFPALGWVTASASAVAIAASTALPPAARTSCPTFDASGVSDTTMKCAPVPVVVGSTKLAVASPR